MDEDWESTEIGVKEAITDIQCAAEFLHVLQEQGRKISERHIDEIDELAGIAYERFCQYLERHNPQQNSPGDPKLSDG